MTQLIRSCLLWVFLGMLVGPVVILLLSAIGASLFVPGQSFVELFSRSIGELARPRAWIEMMPAGGILFLALEADEEVSNGPHSGRHHKNSTEDGMTMQTHFFIVDNRSYQAVVAYQPELLRPNAIAYFLDGLRIHSRQSDD